MSVQHVLGKGDCCGDPTCSNQTYVVNSVNSDIPVHSENGDHVNTFNPSNWMKFSSQLHNFVNRSNNPVDAEFIHKELQYETNKVKIDGIVTTTLDPQTNKLDDNKDITNNEDFGTGSSLEDFVNIRLVDESYSVSDNSPTDVLNLERSYETQPEYVIRRLPSASFLSSAAHARNSDDNLVIKHVKTEIVDDDDDDVEPGCICWPLVHLIYRIRFNLFDKRRIRKRIKKQQARK